LFENINSKFFTQFVDYLINEKKLSNNSIGKVIKILKTFLNWATENNYNKNLEYIKNKSLEKVRDLFCFGYAQIISHFIALIARLRNLYHKGNKLQSPLSLKMFYSIHFYSMQISLLHKKLAAFL